MSKRTYGEGHIERRGKGFRLRYRIGKERHNVPFHGTLAEAKKELRRLLHAADIGAYVAPAKLTIANWIKQWIEAGAPGRKKTQVGQRTLERYQQLLRTHVLPSLGDCKLQELSSIDVDKLYLSLEGENFAAHSPPCSQRF